MATIPQYVSSNLNKVGELLNARLHNIADEAALASFATGLSDANKGLVIYLASDGRQHVWNGASFDPLRLDEIGTMVFRGSISSAAFGELPSVIETGAQYVVTESGALDFAQSWNTANPGDPYTVTYVPGAPVSAGAMVLLDKTGT
jgi:hypothetical protein